MCQLGGLSDPVSFFALQFTFLFPTPIVAQGFLSKYTPLQHPGRHGPTHQQQARHHTEEVGVAPLTSTCEPFASVAVCFGNLLVAEIGTLARFAQQFDGDQNQHVHKQRQNFRQNCIELIRLVYKVIVCG